MRKDTYSFQPRNKGKILLSIIMLAFICIAIAILMAYNLLVTPAGSDARSTSAAKSESKTIKAETKIGVVTGIAYNPLSSCALINDTIVYPGDTIHNVTVVEIQHDTVVFAKGNTTWLQKVLDPPNRAWPKHVN